MEDGKFIVCYNTNRVMNDIGILTLRVRKLYAREMTPPWINGYVCDMWNWIVS